MKRHFTLAALAGPALTACEDHTFVEPNTESGNKGSKKGERPMRLMNKVLYFAACSLGALALAGGALTACSEDGGTGPGDTGLDPRFDRPPRFAAGVPLNGPLDRSKLTLRSAISVDQTLNVARLPLFRGTVGGERVWFVRTDVSDSTMAATLGLNFAPRLANAQTGCPACVQTVQSSDPVPGRAAVTFAGGVDFSPMRMLVPGPMGFPPLTAQPGSVARPGYSDLVRVGTNPIVWNTPIVATGNGPFDVSESHTNTLDRVMAIDTVNMTVDLQFIRAFSHGKDIFYLTFSSSGALSATLERGTFVPVLGSLPFANDDRNPQGSRSGIVAITNGPRGQVSPPAQGLMHVILDNPPGNLSLARQDLLRSLAVGGDAHNVLQSAPTLTDPAERRLYSPMWDLHIGEWSMDMVARGENHAQTDFNTIMQLAARRFLTNPGGAPLGSANNVVNCPFLGFPFDAPTEHQAPLPRDPRDPRNLSRSPAH